MLSTPVTPQLILRGLEQFLERVEQLGVRVNPSSRLRQCIRVLRSVERGESVDRLERVYAHLDSRQFLEIGVQLLDAPSRPLRQKLQILMSDPVVPAAPGVDSKGRDTQFELYLASQFAAGGLHVRFEEPDLIIESGPTSVGIAAKRLKSLARLRERLVDAGDQLKTHRSAITHGLIALDVTHAANPQGLIAISTACEVTEPAAADLTRDAARNASNEMLGWAVPKHERHLLCGCLVMAAGTHYLPNGGVVYSASMQSRHRRTFRAVTNRLADAAETGFSNSTKNLVAWVDRSGRST